VLEFVAARCHGRYLTPCSPNHSAIACGGHETLMNDVLR